ncbi:MAG: DUF3160 domain-containing protein [Polyangiales bacterium]
MGTRRRARLALAVALASACAHSSHTPTVTPAQRAALARASLSDFHPPTGRYVAPEAALDRAALEGRLPGGGRLGVERFLASYPVNFGAPAALDPEAVAGMSAIQASRFRLDAAELRGVAERGFVLAPRLSQTNFVAGYARLYVADQPVYVSADAILNAMHEGYDALIAAVEEHGLAPRVTAALARQHAALASNAGAALSANTRRDLDLYLCVARSLLTGQTATPVAGADPAALSALLDRITAAQGTAEVTLFGAPREVDLSQFTPRGHYAGVPARERYFRAVMWLGREGLRLVDVEEGRAVVRRAQVEAALGLRAISDAQAREAWRDVDATVGALVGEPESLGLADLDVVAREVESAGGLARVDDARLAAIIDRVRGVRPRVATAMLHRPDGFVGVVPEPVAFSLSPQRYTPDAMVLSRVSFDRVNAGNVRRMMPEALDAAFAALGNDQAAALLEPSLRRHDYATELATARALVDAHESSYWSGSLYAAWIASLRTLSPRDALSEGTNLPAVMTTEAWGRRLLNTQMAAWAEARHDTVLYAAQSYSMSLGCSYPSAYVDPYPELWRSLERWSERAGAAVAAARWGDPNEATRWRSWANRAKDATRRLGEIAARERGGEDHTAEQLAWVNDAEHAREENHVCTTETVVDGGWLYDLYEPRVSLGETRAIAADVHTQPDDEHGERVGRVLHVGTARPQALVVVAGPPGRERAYVGYVSRYVERVTEGFARLNDEQWRAELDRATTPAWLAPIARGDDR